MTTCACGNCQFFDNQFKAAANLRKDHSGLCRSKSTLRQKWTLRASIEHLRFMPDSGPQSGD